ncbi:MAG: MMPL family transporter [Gammaproteobacteria bacterium]|nr:MMPL family transporter [Gammaproteobacteria bacterium]
MLQRLTELYYRLTLERPLVIGLATLLLLAVAVWFSQDFKLDASSDSLVLENDQDLRFYRAVRARYGSDDFLMVTLQPKVGLFTQESLSNIRKLRDELAGLERVESVLSILDVPLIDSPRVSVSELQEQVRTLETEGMDIAKARLEFRNSPLYRSLLTSVDEKTTALLVYLKHDQVQSELQNQRDQLWEKQMGTKLDAQELEKLKGISAEIKQHNTRIQAQLRGDIIAVRAILSRYRRAGEIHLGGVPMIASDMIGFVDGDIRMFGIGVTIFLIILLTIAFKRPRWVLIPLLICLVSAVVMVGYLGMMDWRVTVVSSNFISLLLITTLSLSVHLIVRHQELHAEDPGRSQLWMLKETMRSKFAPSIFTSLTTMVAFASLIVSGIRPVIDFGWMMVVGIGMAFCFAFMLFPAALVPLKAGTPVLRRHDATAAMTRSLANTIERHGNTTLVIYLLIVVLGVVGIGKLSVENRFIDYFKESTEIYKGMVLIDQELGGTTPLDVVLEPDRQFLQSLSGEGGVDPEPDLEEPGVAAIDGADKGDVSEEKFEEDMDFDLGAEFEEESGGISGESFWFNMFQLADVQRIHEYLDSLPETGKVLSLYTTMSMMTMLNSDVPLDNMSLAVVHKRLPDDIKAQILDPYMSKDGNQIRFGIRVIDSDINLQRDVLLKKIKRDLIEKFNLEEGQIRLSGMLVLYNNVLQSLFRSQILTLSMVFLAIFGMFLLLFRCWKLAAIGVVPTVVAAGIILGLMGWLGIPLDIMTITIAAITIGIGVDNAIHYVHRFRVELARDGDYWGAVKRCHSSVGRAIYYTSITVTLGFSIMALSSFIPSIYFGILTGIAMVVALIGNLTLLPLLLVKLKPIKAG